MFLAVRSHLINIFKMLMRKDHWTSCLEVTHASSKENLFEKRFFQSILIHTCKLFLSHQIMLFGRPKNILNKYLTVNSFIKHVSQCHKYLCLIGIIPLIKEERYFTKILYLCFFGQLDTVQEMDMFYYVDIINMHASEERREQVSDN